MERNGCGYAVHVEFMDNPKKQGYPQIPHSLGQRKNSVAHIPTATTAISFILKTLKRGPFIRHLFLEFMILLPSS